MAAASVAADPWLTELFATPAGHLVGPVLDELPTGPSFIDAKVPTNEIAKVRALEDVGFVIVDTAVTLERRGRDLGPCPGHIGFAVPTDVDGVSAIAASALTRSRFHLDPRIADSVASGLKAAWVRNFFAGARGDWLVVARAEDRPTGFLLLLDRPDNLVIDLVAVDPDHQSAGIGRAMIAFSAEHCGTAPNLLVGTQAANVGSIRFYESLGFRVVRTEYVLHRHGD